MPKPLKGVVGQFKSSPPEPKIVTLACEYCEGRMDVVWRGDDGPPSYCPMDESFMVPVKHVTRRFDTFKIKDHHPPWPMDSHEFYTVSRSIKSYSAKEIKTMSLKNLGYKTGEPMPFIDHYPVAVLHNNANINPGEIYYFNAFNVDALLYDPAEQP